jgi:hypothetical protein
VECTAAAAAGVLAFGLSEVPEDILDPLAALLYGQHLAWRYRDRRFFTRPFSLLVLLMACGRLGGGACHLSRAALASAWLDVYDGMI